MLEKVKDYKLITKIAAGGMADVYQAEKKGARGFRKVFAIKFMKKEIAKSNKKRKMFIQEAELTARLIHPNIVQIFELGEEKDLLYIVMEYVHGKNLKEISKMLKQKNITWQMASYIIYKSAQALYYAHNLKDDYGRDMHIVHRDISPQNIMVTFSGEIKLADFGIAKLAQTNIEEKANNLAGKYPFMSPEQTKGSNIDYRSDIFSLGIVYYQLLTGKLPFIGKDPLDIIKNIRKYNPQSPKQINPDIPAPISNIVMKCLEKEPDFRYQSALDISKEIENIVPNFITISENLSELLLEKYTQNISNNLVDESVDGAIKSGETQVTKTITSFMDLLREDPNNVEYLEKIGNIYAIHNNYDKAMEYFTRGLAIDDANFLLRFRLAQIYLRKKDKFNFQHQYNILKKIDPDDEHLNLLYLQNLIIFKKWTKAEEEIKKIKKNFQDSIDFLILEADFYAHKKKYSNVINNYLRIAEIEPQFYFFKEEVKKLVEDLFFSVVGKDKKIVEKSNEKLPSIGQNKKVLVVDDDKNIRILLKILLEDMGFSVDIAKNGMNVEKLFELHDYKLFVLDVLLPGMNGFKLIKKLREGNYLTGAIPIIMISGVYKSLQFKTMSRNSGVDAYIEKPFTTKVFAKWVKKVINEKSGKRV